MAFDGIIMALDISSKAMGVCEGRPGEAPRFETVRFKLDDDTAEEAFARALKWAATRFRTFPPDRLIVERRLPTMSAMRPDQSGVLRPTTNPTTVHLLCGLSAIIVGAGAVNCASALQAGSIGMSGNAQCNYAQTQQRRRGDD